jgi:hypothetical protein
VRSHLRKLLCVVCALYLSGAHWMLLQTAAWTGMLVTRAQASTVAEAVKTTFDGDHPCGLCMAIARQQQDEQQKQPDVPPVKKVDDLKVAMLPVTLPAPQRSGEMIWPVFAQGAERRAEEPATPPPLA